MRLLSRREGPPFLAELLPHGLLALHACGIGQIRPASFPRIFGLLGDAAAYRIDVKLRHIVAKRRPACGQHHDGGNETHRQNAHGSAPKNDEGDFLVLHGAA
jgi:hypothetical protein